jgi:hypothetical protein
LPDLQQQKARLDIFLRDYLVCNVDAQPNPIADSIRSGTYQRSVERKQSELWKVIQSEKTERIKLSRGGVDLGMLINMPFGRGPLKDSISFIVKGVHYRFTGKRIPVEHAFLVGGVPSRAVLASQYQHLKSLGHVGSAKIGDNKVFSCFCGTDYNTTGSYEASIWGLLFYDRTYIGCCTLAPHLMKRMNPAYIAQF